jgi:hypothetical protein
VDFLQVAINELLYDNLVKSFPPNDGNLFMTAAILGRADAGEGERRARGGLVTPGPQNEIG